MDISRLGVTPPVPVQADPARSADAAAQFDAMFYRLLMQTVNWTSGVAGGSRSDQVLFGGMIADFIAQEAARQQQGLGAMLLDIEGKDKK